MSTLAKKDEVMATGVITTSGVEGGKKVQPTLARSQGVMVTEMKIEEDYMVVRIPVGGLIEPKTDKDGKKKETHVVVTDSFQMPRSDGKMIKVQISGWYK